MAVTTNKDMAHAVAVALAILFQDEEGNFHGHVDKEPNSEKIYVVTDPESTYPRRWEISVSAATGTNT